MKEKAKLEEEKKDEEKEDPKGIPEFWLTVFKNVDLLSDMLQVRSSRQTAAGEAGTENGSQTAFASSNEKSGFASTCWWYWVEHGPAVWIMTKLNHRDACWMII